MIGHLVRKELRVQALPLALLFGLQAIWLGLLILGDAINKQGMTGLDQAMKSLTVMAPLAGIILGNGAFTQEIRSRTVLFVAALPVSRLSTTLAKLLVTGGGLLFLVLSVVTLVLAAVWRSEPIDVAFALQVVARASGYTLAAWGVTSLGAVLGRYRIPMYLLLLAVLSIYADAGGAIQTVGPFGLLDGIATQRGPMPWAALVESLALGVASLALALVVLGARDGSVAVLLGERMSHAEKLVSAATLIGVLFVAHLVISRRPKEPYRLTDARALTSSGQHLTVSMAPPADAEAARSLLTRVRVSLDRSAEWLDVGALEPVFLVHRGDLDPQRFEVGTLAQREGVLIRANLSAVRDPDDLTAFVLAELLDEHTRSRAWFEPRMWVRDGASVFWPEHFAATATTADPADVREARRDRLLLRALYAEDRGWRFADLDRWHTVRERTAHELSGALAWSVLDALAAARGPEAVRRLVGDVLGQQKPRDVRVLASAHASTALERLPVVAGIEVSELERAWRAGLDRARVRLGERLAALPVIEGELEIASPSAQGRTLAYWVRVLPARSPAWASVMYGAVDPFSDVIERSSLDRLVFDASESTRVVVPQAFAAGSRAYVALALYLPELACEVLASSHREVLR